MKFALVNGDKVEATKGARGLCPSCGSELIAKCGEVNVSHWAHKGNRNCDPWWEPETDWHRSWKDKFPKEWQEVVQRAESGEKHIADVKTESGYVLEFQHSPLSSEERRSRNAFYSRLVWVVDGLKRKRDKLKFRDVLKESISEIGKPYVCRVRYPDECKLLKEWSDGNALVFFDFQAEIDAEQSELWLLIPNMPSGHAYLSPFSRVKFIELHNNNKFDDLVKEEISPLRDLLLEIERSRSESKKNEVVSPNWLLGSNRVRLGRRRRL